MIATLKLTVINFLPMWDTVWWTRKQTCICRVVDQGNRSLPKGLIPWWVIFFGLVCDISDLPLFFEHTAKSSRKTNEIKNEDYYI